LEIKQVWDSIWTPEDEANLSPTDWENLTGVYLFADVCKADGSLSDGQDQYSVIHRLGIATDRSFGDRLADYGYPEKRPHAYYYHKKRREWVHWFRYRWIDIISIDKTQTPCFLPVALENFLLQQIHPTENTSGMPYSLRGQRLVFDD
jgi:hypothetical protein